MKLLLLGDVCPTAATAPLFKEKKTDRLFRDTRTLFDEVDFAVCNLECALTETDGEIKKFGPCLKAPLETAEVLRELGFTLCGISNNHVFDFGTAGARDTIAALAEAGIDYTGFGENYEDSRKNYIVERDGKKIAIVAVCEHEYSYALDNRLGSRPFDEYDTVEDVRRAKANADRVIVMYHGGKEYCEYPSPRLRKLCRALVRAGADVVLCQHSHCIGCYESYEGAHILYGQGNFHFVKLGVIPADIVDLWNKSLAVHYDTEKNEITFTPVLVENDGIRLAGAEEKERILSAFAARCEALKTDAWREGWHEFCERKKPDYLAVVKNAMAENATDRDNAFFAHYLDCEAHSDVWRELFPTYNQTNCLED